MVDLQLMIYRETARLQSAPTNGCSHILDSIYKQTC
jgi:hypothetical protein